MGVDLFIIDDPDPYKWTLCDRVAYRRKMHRLTGLAVIQRMYDEQYYDRESLYLALEYLDREFQVDYGQDPEKYDNSHWSARNCDSLTGGLIKEPTGGWQIVPVQHDIFADALLRLDPKLQDWIWRHRIEGTQITPEDVRVVRTLSLAVQRAVWFHY